MTLKTIALIGWICFALDALFVLGLFMTKNMGDDAAGRGMATGFAIVLAPILLVAGGILLWGTRSGSKAGIIAGALFTGLPFIFVGANFVTGMVGKMERAASLSRRGKFRDSALTQIAKKIDEGDTTAVRALLNGATLDFSQRDAFDHTLLGVAVDRATSMESGPAHKAMVRVLLDAGVPYTADAIGLEADWFSAWACSSGDMYNDMLEAALKHGADPNANERYDDHPMIFSYNMSMPKIRMLVQYGADVQRRSKRSDRLGWSTLMNAVYLREWEWAQFFLDQGVPADYKSADGSSALSILRERVTEEPESAKSEAYDKVRAALERAHASKSSPASK
jgi:hypothetical protein